MAISNLSQDKGEQYERLVAKYYRNNGYVVFKNSTKGKMGDEGLDLIAFSQKENITLLMQCKNQDPTKTAYYLKKEDVEHYIKKFDEHKKYNLTYPKDHSVRGVFVIASKCIDKEAYAYIKNYKKTPIDIIVLAITDDGESVYPIQTQAKNQKHTNSTNGNTYISKEMKRDNQLIK